jgi:hypothetical protein
MNLIKNQHFIDHHSLHIHYFLIFWIAKRRLYKKNTFIEIYVSDGTHIGLNDRLFGAIGVIKILLIPFCIIGPPAESE